MCVSVTLSMIGLLVVNLSMKFGFDLISSFGIFNVKILFIMYVLLLENMIKKRFPEFGGVGV